MSDKKQSNVKQSAGLAAFWQELKRRKVMRVGITYAAVAWLIIQIASTTFSDFDIPIWAVRFVTLMVILGFPIAVIIAWAFELTPDGIKTTRSAREEQGDTPVSKKQQRKGNWMAYAVGAILPTLIFGTLALIFYLRAEKDGAAVEGEKSIAVLPLENLSPDPDNAYFADAVQDEVLTNLAKIGELLVIGRTSTLQYRDTVKTLRQIGSELDVRYLVEGSVFRADNDVRVTVQLIDVETGGHLWADRYDRELEDILGIITDVAKDIASELHAAISPKEIELIERIPTQNQEAYDYFVKANVTRGSLEKVELYEKAVALDPDFAEAWAFLAWFKAVHWRFAEKRNDPALLAEIHHAMDQANRINPNLPHVLHAQGNVIDITQGDIETAIDYFLKALKIDPNFWYSKQALALRYRNLGRLGEAQHYFEEALRTNPISGENGWLIDIYIFRRLWDEARLLIKKNQDRGDENGLWYRYMACVDYLETGEREPYLSVLYQSPGYEDSLWLKSATLITDRKFDAALETLTEIDLNDGWSSNYGVTGPFPLNSTIEIQTSLLWFQLGDKGKWLLEAEKVKAYLKDIVENDTLADPLYWSNLAICYALEGDRESMEATIVKVRELTTLSNWKFRRQARCEVHIAICYLVFGENDKSIEILEAASQMNPSFFLNRYVDTWFIFDRLRANPRFDALLAD